MKIFILKFLTFFVILSNYSIANAGGFWATIWKDLTMKHKIVVYSSKCISEDSRFKIKYKQTYHRSVNESLGTVEEMELTDTISGKTYVSLNEVGIMMSNELVFELVEGNEAMDEMQFNINLKGEFSNFNSRCKTKIGDLEYAKELNPRWQKPNLIRDWFND